MRISTAENFSRPNKSIGSSSFNLKLDGCTKWSGLPLTRTKPFPSVHRATAVAVFYKKSKNKIDQFIILFTFDLAKVLFDCYLLYDQILVLCF